MAIRQALDSRHDGVVRFKATKTHRSARPVSIPPQLLATLMLAAGEHPEVVSERLGHGNPSFTLTVYGHSVPGMHEGASRRSEEALSLPRPPSGRTLRPRRKTSHAEPPSATADLG